MSYLWHLYSFSSSALDRLAGAKDADAEKAVVEVVTWDDWDEGNTVHMERLGRRLVQSSTPYNELSEADAKTLDAVIKMLFAPEGLEQELAVEPESSDGVHPSVIEELASRAEAASSLAVLPILQNGGRRYRQRTPAPCEYCVLSPAEVDVLRREVDELRNRPMAWSAPGLAEVVDECLLSPLARTANKGKSLFGTLG